jgi:flagellar motor protein MotB
MTEVRMPARLGCLFLFLLAISAAALGQQTSLQARISQREESRQQRISQVVSGTTEPDAAAALRQTIHRDAEELSTLSESVKADLQQLRQGMLAKDLDEKLKKMEKLSKKLRREVKP